MTWHSRDTIALVELIFYTPFLFLSAFVCYRHGFSRSSGWLYTVILCIVRIIGGILQFVSHNDHSTGLLETTLVLDSVGCIARDAEEVCQLLHAQAGDVLVFLFVKSFFD